MVTFSYLYANILSLKKLVEKGKFGLKSDETFYKKYCENSRYFIIYNKRTVVAKKY